MPSKKKKYNARFPAGRIKKIMQSDEEVGKVAQAVPVIISRTLELFVESLLTKTLKITNSRNAKTLSTSHMKQCIMSEQRFDFLRELVRNIPDISVAEEAANYNEEDNQSSPEEHYPDSDTPFDLSMPSTSVRAGRQQPLVSNGHNGGVQHMQQQDYPRNYLKRSMSTNPTSSVIRHTTTALSQTNVDCMPAKLARCDSTAVPPQHLSSALITPLVQQQQQQHPRLKHQSYSMPMMHMDNNNKPKTNTPPKQQPTAIPAPIVNIDYTNKPVVKIDYSNLPITAANVQLDNAPLSAPANMASMSGNNTGFNFSTEPVINIDLSNIVASAATAPNATATISIGTPATATTPTSLATLVSSSPSNNKTKTSSTITTFATDQQSHNSKAITTTTTMPTTTAVAEPLKSSTSSSSSLTAKATALAAAVAAATNMTTATISTTKTDSYLDMDEDYDNI